MKYIPLALIKVSKRSFINDTVEKGKFYMSNIGKFRYIDEAMIGDEKEGSISNDVHLFIMNPSLGIDEFVPIFDDSEEGNLFFDSNFYLYCTYGVDRRSLVRNIKGDIQVGDKFTSTYKLQWNVIKGILGSNNVSEYAILVFEEPPHLIDAMRKKCEDYNLGMRADFIEYDNHNYRLRERELLNSKNAMDSCFHKREKYSSQNEFRIAIRDCCKKDYLQLEIELSSLGKYSIVSIEKEKDLTVTIECTVHETDGKEIYAIIDRFSY